MVRTSHVRFSLFQKELWMRLTNTLVSGTISARNGGFAVAPYLCRDYYAKTFLFRDCIVLLHLTYAGIITHLGLFKGQQMCDVAPYLCRDYYAEAQVHLAFAGRQVAPYLCRDYYAFDAFFIRRNRDVAPYLCRDYYAKMQTRIIISKNVAPYLPRYPKAKLPRVSLFFCHPTLPMTG